MARAARVGKVHLFWRAVLVLCVWCSLAQAASATDAPRGAGQQELDAAMAAAKGGNYDEAIRIWSGVLGTLQGEAKLTVHFNLSLAYQRLSKPIYAWYHLKKFVDAKPLDSAASTALSELEAELSKTLVHVRFRCSAEVAEVVLDGLGQGAWEPCPVEWWYAPGVHTVTIRSSQARTQKSRISVPAGGKGVSEYLLSFEAATPPGGSLDAKVGNGESGSTWKWVVGGAGVALMLGGAGCIGAAWAQDASLKERYPSTSSVAETLEYNRTKYNQGFDDTVVPLELAGWAMVGVGAGALAGSLLWWVLADDSQAPVLVWGDLSGLWVNLAW